MSNFEHDQVIYCSMHDQYFLTNELRAMHIQHSHDHPYCETCDRRFLNGNSLRNHFVLSRHHHYCSHCRKMFKTAAGFRMHVEYSPVHSDDSDDEDDESELNPEEYPEGWEDRLGPLRFPHEDMSDDDEDQSWLDIDSAAKADTALVASPSSTVLSTKIEDTCVETCSGGDGHHCGKPPATRIVEYSCPICFATPQTVKATRCGHMFCSPCIRRTLKDSETCPVCRKAVNTHQLRKISMVVPVC